MVATGVCRLEAAFPYVVVDSRWGSTGKDAANPINEPDA